MTAVCTQLKIEILKKNNVGRVVCKVLSSEVLDTKYLLVRCKKNKTATSTQHLFSPYQKKMLEAALVKYSVFYLIIS